MVNSLVELLLNQRKDQFEAVNLVVDQHRADYAIVEYLKAAAVFVGISRVVGYCATTIKLVLNSQVAVDERGVVEDAAQRRVSLVGDHSCGRQRIAFG